MKKERVLKFTAPTVTADVEAKAAEHKELTTQPVYSPMYDMLCNAVIMAGLDFCSTLAGIGAVGLFDDWKVAVAGASISGSLAFFMSLAIQRGLMPQGK